jgi:hypothetical protein
MSSNRGDGFRLVNYGRSSLPIANRVAATNEISISAIPSACCRRIQDRDGGVADVLCSDGLTPFILCIDRLKVLDEQLSNFLVVRPTNRCTR